VQRYILLCTAVKLEALVNDAVKNAAVDKREPSSAKLAKPEYLDCKEIVKKSLFSAEKAEMLSFLKRRLYAASLEPEEDAPKTTADSGKTDADAPAQADPAPPEAPLELVAPSIEG
jgi:hypothetical protein